MSLFCRLVGHVDLRERNDQGAAIWVCQKCGNVRVILGSPLVRGGPLSVPSEIKGKPTGTARVAEKVTPIRKVS